MNTPSPKDLLLAVTGWSVLGRAPVQLVGEQVGSCWHEASAVRP